MKRYTLLWFLVSWLGALIVTQLPVSVLADTEDRLPPIVISEVQAGSTVSASEEFIELYNTTAASINLGVYGWQLEVASSSAANWDAPLRTVPLSGVLLPGQRYVAASQYTASGQTVHYLPDLAKVWFSAGIAASAGHVRLVYTTNQTLSDGTCGPQLMVVDEVEWSAPKNGGTATPSIDGRAPFITAKSTGLAPGSSLARMTDPFSHQYMRTGSDVADFTAASTPTPGADNNLIAATSMESNAPAASLPEDSCDPNPPVAPNDPGGAGGEDDPGGLGGGQENGGDGTPSTSSANQGLLAPQITELLPNPGAPRTDAADEFIELYNPNPVPFDLTGFSLEVGITTKRTYAFAPDTWLPANSYVAFFSAETGLGLSNSGGRASLLDPLGQVVAATDIYGAAKDNQSWILGDGMWQWTLTSTPNAPNAVDPPTPAKAVKAAAISGAKKSAASAVKASAAKAKTKAPKIPKTTKSKTKAKKQTTPVAATAQLTASAGSSGTPLHPGILAVIGVIAVLYGAYEYRYDLANRIRRLRDHRTARRKARQEPAGRGSSGAGE